MVTVKKDNNFASNTFINYKKDLALCQSSLVLRLYKKTSPAQLRVITGPLNWTYCLNKLSTSA